MFKFYLVSIASCFCLNYCMGLSKWFKLKTFMLCIFLKLWSLCNLNNWNYIQGAFVVFNNLINFWNEVLPLLWALNPTCLNLDVEWNVFHVGNKLAWWHVDDLQIGKMETICPTLWQQHPKSVKAQCFKATSQLSCSRTKMSIPRLWNNDSHGHCLPILLVAAWF
jgi:hypothetical protein